MKKINSKMDYEPLRRNRFFVTFTEGIKVEVWRVCRVRRKFNNIGSVSRKWYSFDILETIAHESFLDKDLIGVEISFKIEYLDPKGVVSKTDCGKGTIMGQTMNDLNMEDDDLIYSTIEVLVDND